MTDSNLLQPAEAYLQARCEGLRLEQQKGHWGIICPDIPFFSIDFLQGKMAYRATQILAKEWVVKACLATKPATVIYDLTAGLGRDAFLMAKCGASVVMVERNPVMAFLLQDALMRLNQTEIGQALNLSLRHQNSIGLTDFSPQPNTVLYLDPMHPARKSKGQVKQDIRVVQSVAGKDEDKLQLFDWAMQQTVKRVVLKWPLKVARLTDKKPATIYKGRSTLFEVHVPSMHV